MSITQISEILNVSHPSVIQVVRVMEKRNIIYTNIDATDNRKRILELTENGKMLLKKIKPIWDEISKQIANFLTEGEHSKNLLNGIKEIEENLKKKPLSERINICH
ncbi:MAG: winged helix-turn-helix transcriptional regulator [Bacteroidales bacterium]|nr:winged helix-turn-helix transcriptional regulator [Bacteroidales bacterium]